MTTRQTPDAVREASWTGDPHKLAAELRRVASVFDPTKGFRMPQLLRDAADEIDCLAALDSRAGYAGEVVWRRTALDAAKDCQRVRHSSATPQERDDALRQAATMLRSFADAATPAPAVDAVPDGEDQAARDRRMYDQGRRDERAGEPEAFQ